MHIDITDIKLVPGVDPIGRVAFYDNRIFRLIPAESTGVVNDFINSELFNELQQNDYIPKTWISDLEVDGYAMVLEHEKLPNSQPHHWTFQMYKDAAVLLHTIQNLCQKHGYELKDGHPNNILFKDGKPCFIDFGVFKNNRFQQIGVLIMSLS